MTRIIWSFLNLFSPFTYNQGKKFDDKNFGTIEINWEEQWIEFSIRDTKGQRANSHQINISELYLANTVKPLFDYKIYN